MTNHGNITVEPRGFNISGNRGKLQLVSSTKNTDGVITHHNIATRIVIKLQDNNGTVKTRKDIDKVTMLLYDNNENFIKSTDLSNYVLGGINQSHHFIDTATKQVHQDDANGAILEDINGDQLHAEELTIDLFNDDIAKFFTTNTTGAYNQMYKFKLSAIEVDSANNIDYISNIESIGWLDIDNIVDITPRLLSARSDTHGKLKFELNILDQTYSNFKLLFNGSDTFNIPVSNLYLDAVLKIGDSEKTISNVGIADGSYEKDYTSVFAPGSDGATYDKVESLVARLQLNNNNIAYASNYIELGTNGVVVLEPKAEVVRNLETYFDTDSENIVVRYKIPENKVTDSGKPITKYRIFYTTDSNTVESIADNQSISNYDDTNIWGTRDVTNNLTNHDDQFENVLPATSLATYEDKLVAVTVVAYTGNGPEFRGDIKSPSIIYKPKTAPNYLSSNLTTSLGTSDKSIKVEVPIDGNGLIDYTQYTNSSTKNKLNTLFKIKYEFKLEDIINSTSNNFDVNSTLNSTVITRANYEHVTLKDLKAQRKMLDNRTGSFSGTNFNVNTGVDGWYVIDTNKIEVANNPQVTTYPKVAISGLTEVKGASTKSDATPYNMLELRGVPVNATSLQTAHTAMIMTFQGGLNYEIKVQDNNNNWNVFPSLFVNLQNINNNTLALATLDGLTLGNDYTGRIKARLVFKGTDPNVQGSHQTIDSAFHIVTADSVVQNSTKGSTPALMLTPWVRPTLSPPAQSLIDSMKPTAELRSSDKKYNMNFSFSLDLASLSSWPTKIKVTVADNSNFTGSIEEEEVVTPSSTTSVNILVDNGFEYNKLYYYKIEVLIGGLTNDSNYTVLSTLVAIDKTVELTTDTDNSNYKIPANGQVNTDFSLLTANSAKFEVTLQSEVQDIFRAYLNAFSSTSISSKNKLYLQLQRAHEDESGNIIEWRDQDYNGNGWTDGSGNAVALSLNRSNANVYDFGNYTFCDLTENREYRVKYTMTYDFDNDDTDGDEKTANGANEVTYEVRTYGIPELISVSDNGSGSIKVEIDGNGRTIEGASVLVSDNVTLQAATKSPTPAYDAEETKYIFTWGSGMGQIKTAIITIQPGHLNALTQPSMEVYIVKRDSNGNWGSSWGSSGTGLFQHLTASS